MTEEPKPAKLADADVEVLRSAATGEGLVKIETAEQMKALVEAAEATISRFQNSAIVTGMTAERAQLIRKWRVDEGYTWRSVAQEAHDTWQGDWSPPSNQLMGMALCEKAAEILGEHYMESPWNE